MVLLYSEKNSTLILENQGGRIAGQLARPSFAAYFRGEIRLEYSDLVTEFGHLSFGGSFENLTRKTHRLFFAKLLVAKT